VGLGIQGSYSKIKWRPSQHQYKKFHRYGGKTAPIPPKILLKNLKTSKNFKKTRPPASENL
jgi:hypothetical protein